MMLTPLRLLRTTAFQAAAVSALLIVNTKAQDAQPIISVT